MHSNLPDFLLVWTDYLYPLIVLLVLLVVLGFFILFLSGIVKKIRFLSNKYVLISFLFFSISILSIKGFAFNEIFQIVKIVTTSTTNFKDALGSLGIDEKEYIFSEQVQAKPGKNIIVISLESVEKGYLSDNYAHLTPNLRKLSKEMIFYTMPQGSGSGWTSASLYTYFTGVPAFFKSPGNEVFQNSLSSQITGISHVLNAAGYSSSYFIGKPEFAGISDILKTFGVAVKSEKTFATKYPQNIYGINDKDLFSEAQKELLINKNAKKPFALFISTVNTHGPHGLNDPSMKEFVSEQRNILEFTVASVDYLIGDFISFLKKEKILENTVIYLFPDHLLMQKFSQTINDFPQPRGLYLMTNANSQKISYTANKHILQIDLPKIILEGAEIEHNVKFLTDFIETDKTKFIKFNKSKLLNLNESSLHTEKAKVAEGYYFGFKNYAKKIIKTFSELIPKENDTIQLSSSINKEVVLDFCGEEFELKNGINIVTTFENSLQLQNFNTADKNKFASFIKVLNAINKSEDFFTIVLKGRCSFNEQQKKQLNLCDFPKLAALTDTESYISYFSSGFKQELVNEGDINIVLQNNIKNKKMPIATIYENAKDVNRFIAHAGGVVVFHKYTNSLEALDLSYKKGFRLFELDIIQTSDSVYVAAHDWKHWKKIANFGGDVPVSNLEFLQHKIHSKYTPMNMDSINAWFKNHADAILITDKVNTPKDFSEKFIDKNRLMMELFSMNALIEGLASGIKSAMPSQNVIAEIQGDKVKKLVDLGVKDIAISVRMTTKSVDFLKKIKKSGINTYVFHVNFDKGHDEVYVLTNKMNLIYGMYADDWFF